MEAKKAHGLVKALVSRRADIFQSSQTPISEPQVANENAKIGKEVAQITEGWVDPLDLVDARFVGQIAIVPVDKRVASEFIDTASGVLEVATKLAMRGLKEGKKGQVVTVAKGLETGSDRFRRPSSKVRVVERIPLYSGEVDELGTIYAEEVRTIEEATNEQEVNTTDSEEKKPETSNKIIKFPFSRHVSNLKDNPKVKSKVRFYLITERLPKMEDGVIMLDDNELALDEPITAPPISLDKYRTRKQLQDPSVDNISYLNPGEQKKAA